MMYKSLPNFSKKHEFLNQRYAFVDIKQFLMIIQHVQCDFILC